MKFTRWQYVRAFLVMALACVGGCIDPYERGVSPQNVGGGIDVITLEDGTRCATFKVGYAGGIDCDWSRESEQGVSP